MINLNGKNIPFTSHTTAISNADPLGGWKIMATGKRQPGLANTNLDPMNDVLLLAGNPKVLAGYINYKVFTMTLHQGSIKSLLLTGMVKIIKLISEKIIIKFKWYPWLLITELIGTKNLNLSSGVNIDGWLG